jgi:hypothetical protein
MEKEAQQIAGDVVGSISGSLSFAIVQGTLELPDDICLNVKKVEFHQVGIQ